MSTLILFQVRDTDFSAFKYFDKSELKSQSERPYAGDKTSFSVSRGQQWYLDNKRPRRLRSCLKELEDLVSEQSVIFSKWRSGGLFQLVLQSGLIANIRVNKFGDLTNISYDKYLVGKLSEHVTDCILTTQLALITYLEPRVTLVIFSRPVNYAGGESLVNTDPRHQSIFLLKIRIFLGKRKKELED